jgi:hypothetical protein
MCFRAAAVCVGDAARSHSRQINTAASDDDNDNASAAAAAVVTVDVVAVVIFVVFVVFVVVGAVVCKTTGNLAASDGLSICSARNDTNTCIRPKRESSK